MGQGTNPSAFGTGGSNVLGGGQNTGLSSLLNQYSVPIPDIATAYMQSFGKGGPINVPSYQELYGSYAQNAQQATDRAVAQTNEAFGSQGARYSSDLLGAQGQLRRNLNNDLAVNSGNLLQNLRGQQFNEASGLAGLQYGIEEAGMSRLFQDFLRRTSPPPLLGAGLGFNPSQPGTAIF